MTAKLPRSAWLLLVAALALVAAGCGGESRLSEDDYIDEFDSTCQDISDELEALDTPEDNVELADQAEQAVEITTDGLAELSDIKPPEDLQDEVDDLLGLLQDQIDLYQDLADAAADDDDETINSLAEDNATIQEDLVAAGDDIGLECFADAGGDQSTDLSSDLSDTSSDLTSDFSDDLSSDLSTDATLGEPVSPVDFIAEYGTDATFDGLADSCFAGDLAACDALYNQTPVSDSPDSYEGYGATCGGRLPAEEPNTCATRG